MVLTRQQGDICFQRGASAFSFYNSGDVHAFTHGSDLVNGYVSACVDGSLNQIVLRVYEADGSVHAHPLLGFRSGSHVEVCEGGLRFAGSALGVTYRVVFCPVEEGLWLWQTELRAEGKTIDLLYVQDVGVGEIGGVQTNELYTAQYLDHSAIAGEHGWIIASRQNMPQGGRRPCLWQGMLSGRAISYATDGMQVYGLDYKLGGQMRAWTENLPGEKRQGELAVIALQTEKTELNGEGRFTFFGLYESDRPDTLKGLPQKMAERIGAICPPALSGWKAVPSAARSARFGKPYSAPAWEAAQWDAHYPERELEEYRDGKLLSFFLTDHTHVVSQEKELLCERPHGTIMTTLFDEERVNTDLLTSTAYMYGALANQLTLGNTSFHKCTSVHRGLLNTVRTSGVRLYIELDGRMRLLLMPSAFAMNANGALWHYTLPGDELVIRAYAAAESTALVLRAQSASGRAYRMMFTMQAVLGDQEHAQEVLLESEGAQRYVLRPQSMPKHPELAYYLDFDGDVSQSDDRVFFEDGQTRCPTLLTFDTVEPRAQVELVISGSLTGEKPSVCTDAKENCAAYQRAYERFMRGFSVNIPSDREKERVIGHTAFWYLHNAMVHFLVPHGLEQSGGAAWGTRDVCQGPFELLMITGHYALARETLLKVFAHQAKADAQWPQWFMFDRYQHVYAPECHGDVIFWPLKCLGDYLTATGDRTILDEPIGFLEMDEPEQTLGAHLRLAVTAVGERFMAGTDLISYAGGDWDDTLQPAREEIRDTLCSAWTQALAYHTFAALSEALPEDGEIAGLLSLLESGFDSLVQDGMIAGFIQLEKDGMTKLVHPQDTRTGLRCRLLPLTRSIIAQLVSPEQAKENMRQIDQHLRCPDGVRLLDRPVAYTGGNSVFFKRAEQAANVGREIGLQYVHAHIRYIESLAVLGEADKAWEALLTIAPPLLTQRVGNAALRQSNMYFSSSDGDFADRYAFSAQYDALRRGEVAVKGGWRLYSSGPGIYLARLIGDLLGVRIGSRGMALDPVVPAWADGMTMTYAYRGVPVTVTYCAQAEALTVNGEAYEAAACGENRYRRTGFFLPAEVFSGEEIRIVTPIVKKG